MHLVALQLALLLVAAEPAPAPAPPDAPKVVCKPLAPGETIRVDLDEVPLVDLARLVSCALERNILFDPPALGAARVTVLGPRPIGRRDLDTLWRAVLLDHGLEATRHGAFERVRAARP